METDQHRFLQDGPRLQKQQSKETDQRMICNGSNMDFAFPIQGFILVDTTSGLCADISLNLSTVLKLDTESLKGKSVDQFLKPESDLFQEEWIDEVLKEITENSHHGFAGRIFSPLAEYDCTVTALNEPNRTRNSNMKILLIVFINNHSSLEKNEVPDSLESWLEVRSGVHTLNNFMTAFYCHWDLIRDEIPTNPNNDQSSKEISNVLESISQELRNLSLISNSQITKQ